MFQTFLHHSFILLPFLFFFLMMLIGGYARFPLRNMKYLNFSSSSSWSSLLLSGWLLLLLHNLIHITWFDATHQIKYRKEETRILSSDFPPIRQKQYLLHPRILSIWSSSYQERMRGRKSGSSTILLSFLDGVTSGSRSWETHYMECGKEREEGSIH